ncbi:MAG: DUF4296 domain-containing protein [Rhodothermales bacterium]
MKILYLSLLPLSLGCAKPETPPVADSTMVDLLIEFHLVNARYEVSENQPLHLRDSILARYGVDSATFVRAASFYADNPDRYDQVYSRVLDRLNVERLSLPAGPDSVLHNTPAPTDSLYSGPRSFR